MYIKRNALMHGIERVQQDKELIWKEGGDTLAFSLHARSLVNVILI